METVFLRGQYEGDTEVLEEALLDGGLVNITRHDVDASGIFEAEWFATEEGVTYVLRVTGEQTGCVQDVEVMLVVAGETPPDTAAAGLQPGVSQPLTIVGLFLVFTAGAWVILRRRMWVG